MSFISHFNPVSAQKTRFAKAVVNEPAKMQKCINDALTRIDNMGDLTSSSVQATRAITRLNQVSTIGTKLPCDVKNARRIACDIRTIIKDLSVQEKASRNESAFPTVDVRAASLILQNLLSKL